MASLSERLAQLYAQLSGAPWQEGIAISDMCYGVYAGTVDNPQWVWFCHQPEVAFAYLLAHPRGFTPGEVWLREGTMGAYTLEECAALMVDASGGLLGYEWSLMTLGQMGYIEHGSELASRFFSVQRHLDETYDFELRGAMVPVGPDLPDAVVVPDAPGVPGVPGVPCVPGAPGVNGPPPAGMQVQRSWMAGKVKFYLFTRNGRSLVGCYNSKGVWREWRPYKPLALGKRPTAQRAARVVRGLEKFVKNVRKVMGALGYKASRK